MSGSAIISPCGRYRLRLDRVTGDVGPVVAIIGVNPSTADATKNDHTIRKDIGFATRLGWSRIIKANLCGYRATDVRELAACDDPVGPDTDLHLLQIMTEADIIVAAWGASAKLPAWLRHRYLDVVDMAEAVGKPLFCFGTAKDGQPRHTLTLAYSTPLVLWCAP